MRTAADGFGARFLDITRGFPAPTEGMACGARDLIVDFAGGPYLFSGLSRAQVGEVEERFAGFCRTPHGAEYCPVRTRVAVAEGTVYSDPEFVGEDYYYDTDFGPSMIRLVGWNFMACLHVQPTLSATLWTRTPDELVTFGVFENFFRVLVAYRLLELGGILLHSAAVVTDGRARIFFGRSGAGKSTVARLGAAAGGQVLSDDLNALVVNGDRLVCQKVPFAGDFGGTRRGDELVCPVAGVYRLRQGECVDVHAMTRADALSALMVCSPFVNHDPYRVDQLLSSLDTVTGRVDVNGLTFGIASNLFEVLQ